MNRRIHKSRPRIFYGWWIVLGGIVGMLLGAGFNYHGLNAFVIPVSHTFGVSLTAVTTVLAVARIETAFIGPLEGYLIDRFGPRTMMFLGVPLMGVGFLVLSVAQSFTVFIVVLFLGVIMGSSLGFGSPITTAVANWWHRHRGRAFGIMWLGISVGAIMVPLVNQMIEQFGWRWAVRIMGVLVLLMGLPVAAIMRHRPEQYGMLPDGDVAIDPVEESHQDELRAPLGSQPPPEAQQEFTLVQALRSAAFWYFSLSYGLRVGVTSAVGINIFPLVQSIGGTTHQASLIFLVHGVFSAPGRLFLSWAGDYFNKRFLMAGLFLVLAVCVFGIGQVTSLTALFIVYIPYAVSWGGLSSLPQSFQADLFGRQHYATIRGASAPMQSVFSLIAPPFATLMFERVGSYAIPFTLLAGTAVLAALLVLNAKPSRARA